jgi:hypothetical protein
LCGRVFRGPVVRRVRLPVGESLCRWKAHERHRHETRPEGFRAEQSVKRLRKPEGAAQPELVASVLVAARCLKRWRVAKLHGRAVDERRARAPSGVRVRRESASDRESCFVREVNGMRARLECFGAKVGGR